MNGKGCAWYLYFCATVGVTSPAQTFKTLVNFNGSNGLNPSSSLIQASDGNFYGTTVLGGANNDGTVFKITAGGMLTTLHSFGGADGAGPVAGLVQASDGNFYGTTFVGGANNDGTVFRMTAGGTLTTLHSFGGADGASPVAGLVQASDRSLYGTTSAGGANNDGTVFNLALNAVQFHPVTPCRLLDTREPGSGGPVQGGTAETFNLPELAAAHGCAPLSSAAAYSLNVTLIPQNGMPVGYLTLWPAGEKQPYVSLMNSDGRIKANAAIVGAGASGGVSVYVTDTSDVVLDIDGYFAPELSGPTLAFYPLPPCRVADTRNPPGDLGGPQLTGGMPRNFPLLEATSCNIPNSAQAYSLNLTVVPHGPLDYLTVWPAGEKQPYVSTLNAPTGTAVANAAIVVAGSSGDISTYGTNDTDLVIDINGYFAPAAPGGLSLYTVAPCRVLDTRTGHDAFTGFLSPPVDVVGSPCKLPLNQPQAYVFNATVVPPGILNSLTLWADGSSFPDVSTLNAYDGAISSNMAIVSAGNEGKIDAFAYDLTQLILDISSYFGP